MGLIFCYLDKAIAPQNFISLSLVDHVLISDLQNRICLPQGRALGNQLTKLTRRTVRVWFNFLGSRPGRTPDTQWYPLDLPNPTLCSTLSLSNDFTTTLILKHKNMPVISATLLRQPLHFPRLLPKQIPPHPIPVPRKRAYAHLNAVRDLHREMDDLSDEEDEMEDIVRSTHQFLLLFFWGGQC